MLIQCPTRSNPLNVSVRNAFAVGLRSGLLTALLLPAVLSVVRADTPDSAEPDTTIVPFVALPAEVSVSARQPPAAVAPPPGTVRLRGFRHLHWTPDTGLVHAEGHVEFAYTEPGTKAVTTLNARDIAYNYKWKPIGAAPDVPPETQVDARGEIVLVREGTYFTGNDIRYNFSQETGTITNARVDSDVFQMQGETIELESNLVTDKATKKTTRQPAYVVTNGSFTTCGNDRPDYRIAARRLTLVPGQYVSASKITFYVGPTRLITLPFPYRRNLKKASTSRVEVPQPGYSKAEGLTLHIARQPLDETHTTLNLDFRVSTRYLPIGFVLYNRDLLPHNPSTLPPLDRSGLLTNPLLGILGRLSPPDFQDYTEGRFPEELGPRATFYAALQHRQFVFNRNKFNNSQYNLLVSRFPEVGVEFANVLGHFPAEGDADPALQRVNNTEIALHRIPNAPFLLDAGISAGVIDENPTRATSGRLAGRVSVATQPLLLGRRLSVRAGATDWLNLYTRGTAYNLLMPEVDLNYIPTRTSLFTVGYRYETDVGRTPFLFDRRDLRHELHLRYQVGGPWAFGIATSYNLENFRTFETQVVALRNFDCMQVGIGYRFQAQQFNVIFNLLPPTSGRVNRRRAPLAALDVSPEP